MWVRPLDWLGFETPFDQLQGHVFAEDVFSVLSRGEVSAAARLLRRHNPTLPLAQARSICRAIHGQLHQDD